jgi:predicted amidophosphoribosyltransferase
LKSLKVSSPGSCHGCSNEWADACDNDRLHLPSEKGPCLNCSRNPTPKVLPALDHFEPVTEGVERIVAEATKH